MTIHEGQQNYNPISKSMSKMSIELPTTKQEKANLIDRIKAYFKIQPSLNWDETIKITKITTSIKNLKTLSINIDTKNISPGQLNEIIEDTEKHVSNLSAFIKCIDKSKLFFNMKSLGREPDLKDLKELRAELETKLEKLKLLNKREDILPAATYSEETFDQYGRRLNQLNNTIKAITNSQDEVNKTLDDNLNKESNKQAKYKKKHPKEFIEGNKEKLDNIKINSKEAQTAKILGKAKQKYEEIRSYALVMLSSEFKGKLTPKGEENITELLDKALECSNQFMKIPDKASNEAKRILEKISDIADTLHTTELDLTSDREQVPSSQTQVQQQTAEAKSTKIDAMSLLYKLKGSFEFNSANKELLESAINLIREMKTNLGIEYDTARIHYDATIKGNIKFLSKLDINNNNPLHKIDADLTEIDKNKTDQKKFKQAVNDAAELLTAINDDINFLRDHDLLDQLS